MNTGDVFSMSDTLFTISPVPTPSGEAYVYRMDNLRSRDSYVNANSARADARRVQYVGEDGRLEPLDRAIRYGRAPSHLAR